MKNVSKWILIIWSILCFIGICWGVMSVAAQSSPTSNEYESAGQAIGLGCGMGIWFVIWIALAGPALAVYVVSGKKEAQKVEIVQRPFAQTSLCKECGKYYEGQQKFCPNCGKETNPQKPAVLASTNPIVNAPAKTPATAIDTRTVQPHVRLCSKCNLPMDIKEHQGKKFYVCPNYKQCQQVFPVQ